MGVLMNRAAQQLGRKGKGKPKTMTDAALQQRRAANQTRWFAKKRRKPNQSTRGMKDMKARATTTTQVKPAPPITALEFDETDFPLAEQIARKLGVIAKASKRLEQQCKTQP